MITSRNPFFYSGHFNLAGSDRRKRANLNVAIPSFIQGISTPVSMTSLTSPLWGSQSLLFFRAFQPSPICKGIRRFTAMSQSLLFFRAFQPLEVAIEEAEDLRDVAIPSFFQGISTAKQASITNNIKISRNPFFFSGHFNIIV